MRVTFAFLWLVAIAFTLDVAHAQDDDRDPLWFSIQLLDATTADLRNLTIPLAVKFDYERTSLGSEDKDLGKDWILVVEYRRSDAMFFLARHRKLTDCVDVESYAWLDIEEHRTSELMQALWNDVSEKLSGRVRLFRQPHCGHAL